MPENTPPAPAGWYDDSNDASIQRYWDGATWTDHTAPKNAVPASAPVAAAAGVGAVAGGGFLGWWRSRTTGVKALLIAAAVIIFLVVVSNIANAANGGRQPADTSVDKPAAVETPEPEPSESAVEATEAPVEEPKPDATYFKTQATGNVEDYEKDLADLIVTLDENGIWRLFSNSIELSFNLGQLQALYPTENIAPEWTAALATLEAQTTAISDDISNEQYDTLRADIAAAQATSAQLKEIASRAVTS